MSNRLYVANISFNATDVDLKNHFANVGSVNEAKILNDRDTGRSRGFGFVTMATANDAELAIARLNDQDFLGRRLFVSVARDRNDRGGGGFQDRAPRNSSPNDGYRGNSSAPRTPNVAYRARNAGFEAFDRGFAEPAPDMGRPDRGARRSRNVSRNRDHDDF